MPCVFVSLVSDMLDAWETLHRVLLNKLMHKKTDSSKVGVLEGVKGQSEGQNSCRCGKEVKSSNPWEKKQISKELRVGRKDGKAEVQ